MGYDLNASWWKTKGQRELLSFSKFARSYNDMMSASRAFYL